MPSNDRLAQLQQMLEQKPADTFIRYALGMEYYSGGQREEGEATLRKLNQDTPDYVPAYFQLAQRLVEDGREDEARQVLDVGIEAAKRVGDDHALGEMTEYLDMI